MDKERFIALCKAGDEYALGLLYTNYAPRMKRLCQRYVGDEATAEDIVHDGFIIIMSRIRQLKDAQKLDSWMAAIMRNLAIRHLARNGKAIFIPIEEIEESEDFANDTLEIVSEYKELLKLVETLPNGYRSVFKLSVFDGMSHKEIAELLGINPHSSSSQLARAKEMLRKIVAEYGYVPIAIALLVYAYQLEEPKRMAMEIKKAAKTDSIYKKVYRKNVGEATPPSPHISIVDSITIEKENTTTIEKTDTIILPNIKEREEEPYYHIAEIPHSQKSNNNNSNDWLASVSYTGGTDANSSVFTTIPDIGSEAPSTDGEEKVETKTHHYMPFIVSLSLQKSIGNNFSIGTGLRYTRLKTDITTIGKNETINETQKVEYIGIPLSLSYNLWRTGNLSLYTSAGIAADIPVSGSKTWQWSLSVGAGLQYYLTPSLSLFAEPSLNYHLNSNHGTLTIWTDRPFDITVPLGLRLEW